jgi:CBS domain-containing protein
MNHNDILGVTMAGLEAGFKVLHIAAFDLSVCSPDDDARHVLSDQSKLDFDHIPVRKQGRIIGVLERSSEEAVASVRERMRPLDDSILVSAEETLSGFLPTLKESPYRLVVTGPEIRGIVTISDVAKLPIRLLAFTSVAHLESVLTAVIRANCSDDAEWLSLLEGQGAAVEKRFQDRKKQNVHLLSPIEVAYLGERITAVSRLKGLEGLEVDRKSITNFRNSLAHDGDFVKDCGGVNGLLDRLACIGDWTSKLKIDDKRPGNDA